MNDTEKNLDNALLALIDQRTRERKEAGQFPYHILYMELYREVKNSLNRLWKSGKITVGETANDKYIEVK